MMKKLENWITCVIKDAIKNSPIEERVGKEIEKLRYDYLPHGACWMCSLPISRDKGYFMWKGKMFHNENCLEKYHTLVQKPDKNYKILDNEPVEVFNPKK